MKPSSFFWFNLIPLVCVIIAAGLAMYEKAGWGWFLFVAVCFMAYPTNEKE
jgi:hypothetical protein